MNQFIPIRVRIMRLLLNGHSTITFILGVVALLLSMSFAHMDYPTSANSYKSLLDLMSFKGWATVLYIYGISKIVISMYRTPYAFKVFNILTGLWVWSYLALSLTIFDPVVLTVGLIMITPILCEVWDFSMSIFARGHYIDKRKLNASTG